MNSMLQKLTGRTKHKKLMVAGALVALLVLGFFVYKYSYIYIERRKYDQATVAINKVADDLRAQGIETTFSKGCKYANPESNSGPLGCSVGIVFRTSSTAHEPSATMNKLYSTLKTQHVVIKEDLNFSEIVKAEDYAEPFKISGLNLSCNLSFTDSYQDDYSTGIYCGDLESYPIF